MADDRKYRAPALEKGLSILELLSGALVPLNMTEIGNKLSYSNSEIFRMLQVLEERNYIMRSEDDSGYVLTNRLFMLAMERPANRNLVQAALPTMHRLAAETSHPCHLVVASRDQMVVVARVDSPGDLGFVVRVGYRRPIANSTSGLVMFAHQSDDVREQWLAELDELNTGYKKRKFVAQADEVVSQGYAKRPSDVIDGVWDLSAPILDHGYAAGALAIPFIETHPTRNSMKKTIEHLIKAARDISDSLPIF